MFGWGCLGGLRSSVGWGWGELRLGSSGLGPQLWISILALSLSSFVTPGK